jgi:ABC-type Fe3+ transport system substrate-binding protein
MQSRLCVLLCCASKIVMPGFLLFFSNLAYAQENKYWQQTIDAAKKEGSVVVYIYRYERVLEAFKKEYPEIKVISVTGTGAQLSARLLAERRAGKYIADVFSSGATTYNQLYPAKALDPIRPLLLLPEVVDESKFYGGKHRYLDPERDYVFAYLLVATATQLYYNSNLTSPNEFASHYDLLKDKWKGKIVSLDPRIGGLRTMLQFLYYHPDLGPAFLKTLYGGMQLTLSRDSRQMTDWLAQGKFPLCIGCKDAERAKHQGLPVASLDTTSWKEGGSISAGGGTLAFLNRAPHPNAAKVLVNWLLSRKGQIAMQTMADPEDSPNSRRIDIPKDNVSKENMLVEGRRYMDMTDPKWNDMRPISNLIEEIVKARE